MELTDKIRKESIQLWKTCVVKPIGMKYARPRVATISANKSRYEEVAKATGVPWYFIACAHEREAGLDFNKHLHNGDSLTARTVRVPEGRPLAEPTGETIRGSDGKIQLDAHGKPKRRYTWFESAVDALRKQGLANGAWQDWSIAGILFKLEAFNGYGYRSKGLISPYIFSMTNHYSKGKFVKDHVYDANAVDKQLGIACVLKELENQKAIPDLLTVGETAEPAAISEEELSRLRIIASEFKYNVLHKSSDVAALQLKLNTYPGVNIRVDGLAGVETSNVLFELTGKHLAGDPRYS